ncbi:MAG: hypothetical protein ACK5XO_11415, partial [Phycisphaerales bacterium]
QHYVGVNPNLREAEQQKQLEQKEAAFLELILRAYKAEKVTGFPAFQGKKAGRLVAIGPVNMPVTRLFVEEIIVESRKKNVTKVDILGFEFEMGLFPNVLDEARAKGIDIQPKYIPAEVFDKRAVEKNQVVFVSSGMFDENWRRYVVKMATGSGKTKVLSLALVWSFFCKTYEPEADGWSRGDRGNQGPGGFGRRTEDAPAQAVVRGCCRWRHRHGLRLCFC